MTQSTRRHAGSILTILVIGLSLAYTNRAFGGVGDVTSTAPDATTSPAVINTSQDPGGASYFLFQGKVEQSYFDPIVKLEVLINYDGSSNEERFTISPIDSSGNYSKTIFLNHTGLGQIKFRAFDDDEEVGSPTTFPVNVTP